MAKGKKLNILPFVDIFDAALASSDEREFKPRDYIYASEIKQGLYDRYLSMKGIEPSNKPNEIALRKFKLGELIEDFFKLVLWELGILKKYEERTMSNFGFGCEVSGRMDVVYGGKWDLKNINDKLGELSFLRFIGILSNAIKKFAELNKKANYDLCGIEIKSLSDIMYNKMEARGYAEPHHICQAFHYAYWTKMPYQLVYFDKNNGRMMSFWIMPDNQEYYNMYMEDIKLMSHYYINNIVPPKEGLIKLENGRFSTNWKVEYSKYLTKEYGFSTKMAYKDYATPIVGRFNRVLDRIKSEKELTDDNKLAVMEMRKMGFEIDVKIESTIDISHEEVVEHKETSAEKLNKLKGLL